MQNTTDGYCLILAGGVGSRLWPMSREDCPKQFLDIFGTGRTLLQQTYDRYARFVKADRIYISTNERYLSLVREQLPEVPVSQILAEPLRRGTLASVAWGALVIAAKRDAQANIIVTPSDHIIFDEAALQSDIKRSLDFVTRTKTLLTLGVRPTRPATEYGYIQAGTETEEGFYRVKSFTEKPELDFAKTFVETGEFYWNVGLFVFNVQSILDALTQHVPEYQVEMPRMLAELAKSNDMHVPEFFVALPKRNIDYGILEHNGSVHILVGHFGWADIGTWDNVSKGAQHDEADNIMLGTDGIMHDSRDNIVSLPTGVHALISGLNGYVVAQEGDVLTIFPRKDIAALRRLKNEAQLTLGVKG